MDKLNEETLELLIFSLWIKRVKITSQSVNSFRTKLVFIGKKKIGKIVQLLFQNYVTSKPSLRTFRTTRKDIYLCVNIFRNTLRAKGLNISSR